MAGPPGEKRKIPTPRISANKTPRDASREISHRFAFQVRGQGQCHRGSIHRKANSGNDRNPAEAEGYPADNLPGKSRSSRERYPGDQVAVGQELRHEERNPDRMVERGRQGRRESVIGADTRRWSAEGVRRRAARSVEEAPFLGSVKRQRRFRRACGHLRHRFSIDDIVNGLNNSRRVGLEGRRKVSSCVFFRRRGICPSTKERCERLTKREPNRRSTIVKISKIKKAFSIRNDRTFPVRVPIVNVYFLACKLYSQTFFLSILRKLS